MPLRPSVPADDLYARLELPSDATPEAIEIAWRSLLRRHHPDVAGPSGLDEAKRINVAHDWLSVPELRRRYDQERGLRKAPPGARTPPRDGRPQRASRARRSEPSDVIADFLERVSRLTADDLDRLAAADSAPIAFGATIQRFLPAELQAALGSVERDIDRRLPAAPAITPAVRDAIRAHAAELVLGPFLDELLSEPFRARTRERLSRGWEAAVDQPRYGPNGAAIRALIERLRDLGPRAPDALTPGGRVEPIGEPPWPPGTSPDDDEGLRVSSVLAARDAAAAVTTEGLAPAAARRARRTAAWLAHVLVLRHAFTPGTFEALVAPWRPGLVPADAAGPRVRRPSRA